jgi:stage III sporulation protein AG
MENNNIITKIKNNKNLRNILIILLSIIIVFLLIFNFNGKESTETKTIAESYIDSLEERLTNVLSKLDGAGDVSVIIKAESGMETVLAKETIVKETSNGKEITETPILVNGKTVTLKELYPKITGVLIVTEGAKNIALMHKIQQATTSLLGVDINCIEILSAN